MALTPRGYQTPSWASSWEQGLSPRLHPAVPVPPWSRLREQPDSRPEVRRRGRRVSRLPQTRASRATGSLGRGCPGGLTEALLAHCRKWELRSCSQPGRHRLPSGPAGLLHAGVRGSRPGQGRRGVPSLHPGSGGPGCLASRSLSVPPVSGRAGREGPGLAHWRPKNPHSWGSASFWGSPLARTGCRARTGGCGGLIPGAPGRPLGRTHEASGPGHRVGSRQRGPPPQTGPAWAAPSPTDGPSVGSKVVPSTFPSEASSSGATLGEGGPAGGEPAPCTIHAPVGPQFLYLLKVWPSVLGQEPVPVCLER